MDALEKPALGARKRLKSAQKLAKPFGMSKMPATAFHNYMSRRINALRGALENGWGRSPPKMWHFASNRPVFAFSSPAWDPSRPLTGPRPRRTVGGIAGHCREDVRTPAKEGQ